MRAFRSQGIIVDMIIRAPWLFWAAGMAFFPFVFIHPRVLEDQDVLSRIVRHERVHHEQQKRWAVYGLGVGLLLWYVLYLFALPVGWNWWRHRWELEAYVRTGVDEGYARRRLRRAPYSLWLM